MKQKGLIICLILIIAGIFVWAKASSKENFSLAKNLPPDALVYLQVSELQEFVKIIGESKIGERYLESENFANFQNKRLGIKLAQRFKDISEQTNLPINLAFIGSLSEKEAAIALYDVGKLDLVFVAPMNETVFSASMLLQNSNRFTKENLADGTNFYRMEVSVDRGRQDQNIIFANTNGFLVLATNEKLFVETHKLITTKESKNSLFAQERFNKLTERISPNLATIWLNQEKLNSDYYFRRYWLMSEVEKLKNIQSGIIDISFNETGLIEKREFLLKEAPPKQNISSSEIKSLLSNISENVPFVTVKRANDNELGEAIYQTLFDKLSLAKPNSFSYNRNYLHDYYYQPSYYYLNSDFEEIIDEKPDNEIQATEDLPISAISNSLITAQPSSILTATKPQLLENPLFAEFQKILIIHLNNPQSFDQNSFENSIVEILKKRITVSDSNFSWKTEKGSRKLNIPLLGWEICYRIKNDKLFISNNFNFLQETFANETMAEVETQDLSSLTVIRLGNREENFDQILNPLSGDDNSFIENIGSLLDVLQDLKQIEIRRKNNGQFLSEEIVFKLNTEQQ